MYIVDSLQELLDGLEKENRIKDSDQCEIICIVTDEVLHNRQCERVKDSNIDILTADKVLNNRACHVCLDNIWDWAGLFNKEAESVMVSLYLCHSFLSKFLDVEVILELAKKKKDSFLLLNETLKSESIINYCVDDLILEAEEIIWISASNYLSIANNIEREKVANFVEEIKSLLNEIRLMKNAHLKKSEVLNSYINIELDNENSSKSAFMVVGPNIIQEDDEIPSAHDNLIRLILAVWCEGATERRLLELPLGVIQALRKWGWVFVHSAVYQPDDIIALKETEKLWDNNPNNPYFFFDKAYSAIKMLNLNQI